MATPVGRREAHKQATRSALITAAKALFEERGFEATTVRDVARAAHVTERTFYRYFDGKEALITEDYLSWLEILRDAIVSRPAAEVPLVAVERAMTSIVRQVAGGQSPPPLWLFSTERPLRALRRFEPRPLLRLEASITDAVLTRMRGRPDGPAAAEGSDDVAGDEFAAQVVSRVAIAAFRSAMIRQRELSAAGEPAPVVTEQLLGEAFAIVAAQAAARG